MQNAQVLSDKSDRVIYQHITQQRNYQNKAEGSAGKLPLPVANKSEHNRKTGRQPGPYKNKARHRKTQ